MSVITKTGVVVLSGGKSSRLGSPKQLLEINGKPLLEHIVDVALNAALGPVVVVTGAYAAQMPAVPTAVVHNKDWEEGMASSIRTGVQYMQVHHVDLHGLIIVVSDQPYLSTTILQALVETQQKENVVAVAARYNNQMGTPVWFHRSLWGELLQLKGDVGAKKILRPLTNKIGFVPFEEGIYDLDTMEDYQAFNQRAC